MISSLLDDNRGSGDTKEFSLVSPEPRLQFGSCSVVLQYSTTLQPKSKCDYLPLSDNNCSANYFATKPEVKNGEWRNAFKEMKRQKEEMSHFESRNGFSPHRVSYCVTLQWAVMITEFSRNWPFLNRL